MRGWAVPLTPSLAHAGQLFELDEFAHQLGDVDWRYPVSWQAGYILGRAPLAVRHLNPVRVISAAINLTFKRRLVCFDRHEFPPKKCAHPGGAIVLRGL